MATRRVVSSSKATSDKDSSPPSSPFREQPGTAPGVPAHVVIKLLFFTLAMVVGPIGTYFLTLNSVFGGNSTFAGALAAIMANAVLVAYVIVAMREDQGENKQAVEKKRR